MNDATEGEILDSLAESFLAKLRRGERPTLTEYAERHPELADEIREIFPALIEMERLKDSSGGLRSTAGPAFDALPASEIPERLGDYRIIRLVGRGGMGVVYEAERESLRVRVALKVLHPKIREVSHYRRRFRNEARSAARLHHSNIVPVFDFGEHEGMLFYVMQFITGQGLDRILEDVRRLRANEREPAGVARTEAISMARAIQTGQYPGSGAEPAVTPHSAVRQSSARSTACSDTGNAASRPAGEPSTSSSLTSSGPGRYGREVARIGAEAAEALAYAHGLGVLHRDIKPSNILIDARGTAWITDFGLAKNEDDDGLTETGDVVGTLRYLAPERFEGLSDTRCDIYALGVTLYEMLALRPAFQEHQRARMIREIVQGNPPALRKLDPSISRDLETVVHKAIARAPSDRYASAEEMAAELRRVQANQPIRSRRTPLPEQYLRWCRQNVIAATLIAVAATLTVAIALVSTTAYVRQTLLVGQIHAQLERAERAEAERAAQLLEANVAEARAWGYSRRPGQRIESLAAVERAVRIAREVGSPPERIQTLRSIATGALALTDLHLNGGYRQARAGEAVDVSEDFALYAITDKAGQCTVYRMAGDQVVARLPDAPGPRQVAFGASRWLVDFRPKRAVVVWDLGEPVPQIRVREETPVLGWDFRADGSLLAISRADGVSNVYDLASGKLRQALPLGEFRREPRVRLHPTEPYLLVTDHFVNHLEIHHIDTGETVRVALPWDESGAYDGDWTHDGRAFAVPQGIGGSIALYDFEPGGPQVGLRKLIQDSVEGGLMVRFNPAGDRLFARGWSGVLSMFDVPSGRKTASTAIFGAPGLIPLRVDPSGLRVFPGPAPAEGSKYRLWSVAEGRECRLLVPPQPLGRSHRCAVSPDGRLLAASFGDGVLALFALEQGEVISQISVPGGGLLRPLFDASGRLFVGSRLGVHRWPIHQNSDDGDVVYGPPELLPLKPDYAGLAMSRNGTVFAHVLRNLSVHAGNTGGWLYREGAPGLFRRVAQGPDFAWATVTPDGRWAAFGAMDGSGVYVYDATTGRHEKTLPGPNGVCQFSPDGRWLAISGDSTVLYSAGRWNRGPALGTGMLACFFPGGKQALLTHSNSGEMRLVEVETGRELARFDDPDAQDCIVQAGVTAPDGSKLVMPHARGVRVWDLRRIREQLAPLGLDWDAPALPPRSAADGPRVARFTGVERLDPKAQHSAQKGREAVALLRWWDKAPRTELERGKILGRLGLYALAINRFNAALRGDATLTEGYASRALVHFRRGEWGAAVEDFTRAGIDRPAKRALLFRRAWALHELGRDRDAIRDLDRALSAGRAGAPAQSSLLIIRSELYASAGDPKAAVATRQKAENADSACARTLNDDAWYLLTDPLDQRNESAALLLARNAAALRPLDRAIQNTLALALYRNGKYAEALGVVAENLNRPTSRIEYWDLFIRAMCQHSLGNRVEAGISFERATAWRRAEALTVKELNELAELEAEARRVLRLTP